jgi:hypothetical protein
MNSIDGCYFLIGYNIEVVRLIKSSLASGVLHTIGGNLLLMKHTLFTMDYAYSVYGSLHLEPNVRGL